MDDTRACKQREGGRKHDRTGVRRGGGGGCRQRAGWLAGRSSLHGRGCAKAGRCPAYTDNDQTQHSTTAHLHVCIRHKVGGGGLELSEQQQVLGGGTARTSGLPGGQANEGGDAGIQLPVGWAGGQGGSSN